MELFQLSLSCCTKKIIMDFEDGEISDNSNDMFIAQDETYENDKR